LRLDVREWEEEQVRLDRDWYMAPEEGTLMGDEEHNPLSQYEDLTMPKPAEIARRPAVSPIFLGDRVAWLTPIRKSLLNKHNTCVLSLLSIE